MTEVRTFILGGYDGDLLNSSRLFNLDSMAWRDGPELPEQLDYMGYTQYRSSLLVVGGKTI